MSLAKSVRASPDTPAAGTSREFAFLVACVRANFDGHGPNISVERDIGGLDWKRVLALARENRVDALLLHGLRSSGVEGVPQQVLAFLDRYETENRARNRAAVEELKTILRAIEALGIRSLVFKGPVLGQHAYRDIGKRFFWDLDFLVDRSDLAAMEAVLTTRGYAPQGLTARQEAFYERYHFAYAYCRPSSGPEIDVHWALLPGNFGIPLDYRGLWERSVTKPVDGVPLRTFCAEDALLHLGWHGAKEEWRRLQMIVDVAALIDSTPDLDWTRCLHLATAQRGRRIFLLAVHMASEWFDAPVPDEIRRTARSDSPVRRLAADVWRRLQSESGRSSSIFAFTRWRMDVQDSLYCGARYWWRTVSTPRLTHLGLVDLPMLPRIAYFPIRLLHDYAALPLWTLGRQARQRLRGSSPRP